MFAAGSSVFSPEDVTVLRDALDGWCLEKRIDIKHGSPVRGHGGNRPFSIRLQHLGKAARSLARA